MIRQLAPLVTKSSKLLHPTAFRQHLSENQLGYEFISSSVLDTAWIDQVTLNGNTGFLLLAEGLFMWLPPQEAKGLLKEFGGKFYRSQLVLDMVPERYTKGIWRELFRMHSRMEWGLDVAWDFGIQNPG